MHLPVQAPCYPDDSVTDLAAVCHAIRACEYALFATIRPNIPIADLIEFAIAAACESSLAWRQSICRAPYTVLPSPANWMDADRFRSRQSSDDAAPPANHHRQTIGPFRTIRPDPHVRMRTHPHGTTTNVREAGGLGCGVGGRHEAVAVFEVRNAAMHGDDTARDETGWLDEKHVIASVACVRALAVVALSCPSLPPKCRDNLDYLVGGEYVCHVKNCNTIIVGETPKLPVESLVNENANSKKEANIANSHKCTTR
jgi:hypothetical protein